MDGTANPRQSIVRVVMANRDLARKTVKHLHTLERLYRGAAPMPERKEPPIGSSILDLSNAANSDLTDVVRMLERMIEDVDLRENLAGEPAQRAYGGRNQEGED